MNTTAINYITLFELAESKGYLLSDFILTENGTTDLYPTEEKALIEMTLIQKWLRDTHKIIVLPRFHSKISVYSYWIIKNENELPLMPSNGLDTYESALMEGTNEALQLI